MAQSNADRNLLFGILAMQMDFITREQLISAMQAWVFDKSKTLGQILVELCVPFFAGVAVKGDFCRRVALEVATRRFHATIKLFGIGEFRARMFKMDTAHARVCRRDRRRHSLTLNSCRCSRRPW